MFRQRVTRIPPAAPVHAYQTFGLAAPIQTHFRSATCAEVECDHREQGWRTVIDPATQLGRRQLKYIRLHSGRHYTDVSEAGSPLVSLLFGPGQECFREHQVPLERDPLFFVRAGDWRGNPTGQVRRHANGDDWVDDCANQLDKINTTRERG